MKHGVRSNDVAAKETHDRLGKEECMSSMSKISDRCTSHVVTPLC
jgi:hypothetical protein